MSTTQGKRPTHRALYEVKGRDDKRIRDIEIGAGWTHKDGKGFSIKLEVAPPAGAFISIREINRSNLEQQTTGDTRAIHNAPIEVGVDLQAGAAA